MIESENRHAAQSKTSSPSPQPPLPLPLQPVLPAHPMLDKNNANPTNNDGIGINTNVTKDAHLLHDNDKYVNANAALSAALAERLITTTTNTASSSKLDKSSYATNTVASSSKAVSHTNLSHANNINNRIGSTHLSSTTDTSLSANAPHTMMPNMNHEHDSLYAVDNNNNNIDKNNNNDTNNYVNVNNDIEDDRRLPMHFPARMHERRRRKEQLGLEVLSVAQLAHNALVALDGERTGVEREMEFLLHGGHLCRFCDVYQLQ